MNDIDKAADDLAAELLAAEVAYCRGQIARAQHRIACGLAGKYREQVIPHLRSLGISEAAAAAFVNQPLSTEDMGRVVCLLEAIHGWRPHLAEKVRALSVASKKLL